MQTQIIKFASVCMFTAAITACSSVEQQQTMAARPASAASNVVDITAVQQSMPQTQSAEEPDNFGSMGQPPLYSSVQGAYKGRPLTKHIGDYVKNMTQDLIANMEYVTAKTPMAVTHFALLDSDLQETNLLGQQMAESFIHELHKFRVPVLDYKATGYIRITENGDFVLSRDYLELNNNLPLNYILTGTMAKHQGGVMVNARIVGVESRAVVASAQMLIPFYVVDALIPSDGQQRGGTRDGVELRRG